VAVAFLLITFLHVVLGELAPKAIALQRAEDVALFVSGPLIVFGRIFRPFIRLMNGAGNWVVKQLKLPPLSAHKLVHSVEELRMLVEETEEAGVIPSDQAEYVENVLQLTNKKVRDIMIPREKCVTINMSASPEDVLEIARETAHTRMPVWHETPDNIVGIVNTKDLFHLFSLRGLVILVDAMYEPLFADPDVSVRRLLLTFRRRKRPMAVVRDGAGKFLGIVTLEDILEEIVGEIEDEHDEAEAAPVPAVSDASAPPDASGAETPSYAPASRSVEGGG
jgi:CBS domain containing-hemolysin-like protein